VGVVGTAGGGVGGVTGAAGAGVAGAGWQPVRMPMQYCQCEYILL